MSYFRALVTILVLLNGAAAFYVTPTAQAKDTLEDLLNEVKIPTLPIRTRQALDFLVAQKGFREAPHDVIKQLKQGESLVFTVNGGPTHEPIQYRLSWVEDLHRVQQEVRLQQQKDRYRPDFASAKAIWQKRLPSLQQQLQTYRTEISQKAQELISTAKTLDGQAKTLTQAKKEMKEAMRVTNSMWEDRNRLYQIDLRAYTDAKHDYDDVDSRLATLRRKYSGLEQERSSINRRIQKYRLLKQEAERLIIKDSKHAKTHRESVERYRLLLSQMYNRLNAVNRQLRDMDSDVDHLESRLERLGSRQREYRRLMSNSSSALGVQTEKKESQSKQWDSLTQKQKQTEVALAKNTQDQQEMVAVLGGVMTSQNTLQHMAQLVAAANNYNQFKASQMQLHSSFASVLALANTKGFQSHFEKRLLNTLTPLSFLLENMKKPKAV